MMHQMQALAQKQVNPLHPIILNNALFMPSHMTIFSVFYFIFFFISWKNFFLLISLIILGQFPVYSLSVINGGVLLFFASWRRLAFSTRSETITSQKQTVLLRTRYLPLRHYKDIYLNFSSELWVVVAWIPILLRFYLTPINGPASICPSLPPSFFLNVNCCRSENIRYAFNGT